MRRILMPVTLTGILIALSGYAVAGTGIVRMSWDDCDPFVQDKNFSGEGSGQIATVVISLVGCDEPNQGHRVKIGLGPSIEDAWRFDSQGCQAGQLEVSHDAANPACPAFQGGNSLGFNEYLYDAFTGTALLDVNTTYDSFTPDPAQRYTLWQAHFDHTNSGFGAHDPAIACGFVENPVCFYLIAVPASQWALLLTGRPEAPFEGFDYGWIAWQDPGNTLVCPVQVRSSTWGTIKALYR